MKISGMKLKLLIWKNWKMQSRHILRTMCEIFAPAILVAIIVGSRSSVSRESSEEITQFEAFSPLRPISSRDNGLTIAWAPAKNNSKSFSDEMRHIMQMAFNKTGYKLHEFHSENELNRFLYKFHVTNLAKEERVLCGVIFEDNAEVNDPKACSRELEMTLRFPGKLRSMAGHSFQTNRIFPTKEQPGPRSTKARGPPPYYYAEGFLEVQHLVSRALSSYCVKKNPPKSLSDLSRENISNILQPKIDLRQYSYPPYVKDIFLDKVGLWIPLVIMLSFGFTFCFTVNSITMEKETRLKDAMRIMGLPDILHWAGWFIKTVTLMSVSAILIVMLLTTDWITGMAVFPLTNGFVFLILIMAYVIATTCFSFMVSVFFSTALRALIISAFIWILTWTPFLIFKLMSSENLLLKILGSLFSNSAMAFGMVLIINSEIIGVGMHWNNIMYRITMDDPMRMGYVLIMLLLDSTIYLMIMVYVDAVFPGNTDVPKRWNYCLKRSYWKSGRDSADDNPIQQEKRDSTKFEQEPTDVRVAIKIRHLHKEYGKDRVAVKDLTLNIYKGQITVLLGHNGAGKTTTMNMLTGMHRPTRGTAFIDGYDIKTESKKIGTILGLCPQHNILFDELTVTEHLYFFGKLKGLSGSPLLEQIRRFITVLDLKNLENVMSKRLSRGVKRKLSVGIALCGSPNVVMLDEPTTGMDPIARHMLWEMLKKEKENNTIVLTTHLMAEAEVLADRIAIIDRGELQCCGSPYFLKRRYGAGYVLTVERGPECEAAAIAALLQDQGTRINRSRTVGDEIIFQLDDEDAPRFEHALAALDEAAEELHVRSYGVSRTSMEEVFMRVVTEAGQYENKEPEKTPKSLDTIVQLREDANGLIQGKRLVLQQSYAMFTKKRIVFSRGWAMFVASCLLPLILFSVAMIPLSMNRKPSILPPLEISLRVNSNWSPTVPKHPTYERTFTTVCVTKEADVNETERETHSILAIRLLYDSYKEIIASENSESQMIHDLKFQDVPIKSFERNIVRLYESNAAEVRHEYIVGASFDLTGSPNNDTTHATGWFNDLPLHSVPLTLHLVANAVLNIVGVSLKLVNFPLPFSPETQSGRELVNEEAIQFALLFGFVMALVTPYYVTFPVKERSSKAKHLQYISGIDICIYWLLHLAWDSLTILVPISGIVLILLGYQEDGYASAEDLGRVMVLLTLFGWTLLPILYIASNCFKVPATAYVTVIVTNIMIVFVGVTLVVTIHEEKYYGVNWILLIIPHYCLVHAIYNSHVNYARKNSCQRVDCSAEDVDTCCPGKCPKHGCLIYYDNHFELNVPGIGKNILYYIWTGVSVMILLIVIEKRLIRITWRRTSSQSIQQVMAEAFDTDSDVLEERVKIRTVDISWLKSEYSILLKYVNKYYKGRLAVNRICIGIKKKECFGLLGGESDGKSTILKIIVGDERMSEGDVYLNGYSLKERPAQIRRMIGYCPQIDALLGVMTGRETLYMYCLIKGIPTSYITELINRLAEDLLFTTLLDKKVKEYSGGSKRKLSIAIALIGGPIILVLDEPTRGLDPVAKMRTWNLIDKIREIGSCVILASNSMDECEALCTRMTIMVNGEFKCLGSSQHLKTKFAQGYVLHIKVSGRPSSPSSRHSDTLDCNMQIVERFVSQTFPSSILNRKYMGFMTFFIPMTDLTCSQIFGILEKSKEKYDIEDYSLGQTSLEQVFLFFCVRKISDD